MAELLAGLAALAAQAAAGAGCARGCVEGAGAVETAVSEAAEAIELAGHHMDFLRGRFIRPPRQGTA